MFTLEQKEKIQTAFFAVYNDAIADMGQPWANPQESIHYSLWISPDIDKVIYLWYGSLFAYCMIPESQGADYTCSLTDYRKRFCGGYTHPDEFLQNGVNHRVADFVKQNIGNLNQFDHKKIISDAETQTKESYYLMDTQWLANELGTPNLNPVDMCFIFKKRPHPL